MPFAGFAQLRRDLVALLVFAGQSLGLPVRHRADRGRELAHAEAVGREAELHFGRHLVAFGHRDLAHVVAEAAELRALPVVPGARGPHPGADAVVNLRVGPMADDDLAGEAHARMDETRLAIAVRRLVQVHEIHVDRAPRQVAIELRVEMQERLLKGVEPADPHLRRRERVHPENEAGAIVVRIRLHAEFRDLVGRGQERLEDGFQRQFRRVGERAGDVARIGGDPLQGTRAVEMLGAANEPDFGSGQIDHERPARVSAFGPWNRSRRGSVG